MQIHAENNMNKTPAHILARNAAYRKRTKYHLKRDRSKQREHVKKSQKKHAGRVRQYHAAWRAEKMIQKQLSDSQIFENEIYNAF